MSPYLFCPKKCEGCPFVNDCYDETLFGLEDYAVSTLPVLEADIVHFMEEV